MSSYTTVSFLASLYARKVDHKTVFYRKRKGNGPNAEMHYQKMSNDRTRTSTSKGLEPLRKYSSKTRRTGSQMCVQLQTFDH